MGDAGTDAAPRSLRAGRLSAPYRTATGPLGRCIPGRSAPRGVRRPCYAPPVTTHRVVAKPVRIRHSPATVTVPSGTEVRSPAPRCSRSNPREKGAGRHDSRHLGASRPFGVPGASPRPLRRHSLPTQRGSRAHHPVPRVPRRPSDRDDRPARRPRGRLQRGRRPDRRAHPDAGADPDRRATPTPAPTPAAAYPLTLTDDEGTAVTIPARPERIVSLTPATTEILFAVGAGASRGRRHGRG